MRLKQISLQGYKTFASKTVFSFEEGITAIVGPNGSGKSNIADALRWVLGEQSYRSLRGRRSIDMIFSGSQERSRAGMAQAILTLNNSDGWLPIDFTEVEIGRRVYRSGDSDYLLNGQKVRLRDVQELLATSGLAERTYTIVGQGLIDQALSLRSEERRALFEEAAGISHYKTRRAETIRRLEETQRNLERVHDILSEINPRMKNLRRQAKQAQDHEQVAADLRHLLRIWYGYNWRQSKSQIKEQRLAAQHAENDRQTSRARLIETQEHVEQLRREAGKLQEQIDRQQIDRERVREQLTQNQRQIAILSERRKSLERQLADIAQDLPHLIAQQAEAENELSSAARDLEDAQRNLSEQEAAFSRFNMSFAAQQDEIDATIARVDKLNQEVRAAQKQLAQAEGQLSQLQERMRERQDSEAYDRELARLSQETERLATVVVEAQAQVNELNEQRAALLKMEPAKGDELKRLRQESSALNQELNQANSELARLEARCEMLDSLRHQAFPITNEVPLLGNLAGLVSIPAEHQTAIAAALGARLGALILPDEQALWGLIALDQGDKAFMAMVAPTGKDGQAKNGTERNVPAGAIAWAHNVIVCAEQIEGIAEPLFGEILLAQDRKETYRLAKTLPAGALVVAPDGFVVHALGLVEFQPQDPQSNILAREEAWRDAITARQEQQALLDTLKPKMADLQAEIHAQQHAVDEHKEEERRISQLLSDATARLQKAQRDHDRAKQKRSYLRQQGESAREEQKKLAQRIAEMQATIQHEHDRVAELAGELKAEEKRLQTLPVAEAQQQRQDWRQKIETARTILAGRSAVVQSRRTTLQQIEGQLRRQQLREEDLQARFKSNELAAEENSVRRLQADLDQLQAILDPLQRRRKDITQQLAAVEAMLSKYQREAHDLETVYTQRKIAVSQRENQLEGLAERIRADLGVVALHFEEGHPEQAPLPIADVVEELPEVNKLPPDTEESILRYRGQLQRMGAINAEAPLEYAETKDRSEFLSQQVADLNRTERQLREVISELDALTSEAFVNTVEVVNEVFSDMFARLFGGGSARLVLTDPDDVTISGVEIYARLPQRRQQSLALLSGGERSLTAAALIFALLQVNPPPFCVMDETDAMLDEVNITRFRDALCELSDKTQVIVITHNRGTVQAAQTVYGISMASDSTSQVISIRPEDYLNHK